MDPNVEALVADVDLCDYTETSRGFQTEVGVYSQTMRREVTPSEADLAFNFYVPKEDLKEEPGPSSSWRGSEGSTAGGDRGRIRLDLYQNTFTLTSGIVDVAVGSVTVPVTAAGANDRGDGDQFRDTLNAPEWRDVERYKPTSGAFGPDSEFVDDQSMAAGALGALGLEDDPRMASSRGPPQILVGVSVKERNAAGSVSDRRRSLSSEAMPKPSRSSPSLYGGLFGKVQRVEPGGDRRSNAGSASGGTGSLGEWTEVEESESDDESLGSASAPGAAATAVPPQGGVSDISARISAGFDSVSLASSHGLEASGMGASRQTSLLDCYQWMDLIGEADAGSALGTETLAAFSRQVEYPVEWVERHARAIGEQWDWLAKVLDVYQQRLAEGVNFRSSLLKKDPVSQYVATNLHIQVWSVRDPSTGKDISYDFVTTGAPAAHALGHANGGLASLQARLRETGEKVLRCRAKCRESCEKGGVQKLQELEGNLERLREALLNYEVATCAVSMRKACVLSQAISIAAASFCAKLEMMARGTLHIPCDLTRGGCRSAEELAMRWTTVGFLLGFEGLLSIQGKELGMVEDTVAAMEMLEDFQLEVLPATPDQPLPKGASGRSGMDDVEEDSFVMVEPRDKFELEVGVSGKTIQCLVGGASLARLPRVLWDKNRGSSVKIIPVFFTQGIDIQQSMSHASSLSKEKSAFQADINAQNLAKLSRYCYGVCAHGDGDEGGIHGVPHLSGPSGMTTGSLRSSGTQGAGGSGIGPGGRASNPFGSFISSSGGSFSLSAVMPGLPRASSRQAPSSATNQPGQDLLDLGDFAPPTPGDTSGPYVGNTFSTSSRGSRKASFGSRTPVSAVETPSPSAQPGSAPLGRMHPALLELEAAVRDDKINHKNTAILLEAQLAVRRLCGGRVTFCKSGKDRTAMSVTLEEALLLAAADEEALSCAGVDGAAGAARGGGWRASERNGVLDDANVLRAHGCRLVVAEKNVGRPLYSFNALQRQFIPELYQPPMQTIQDVITSALNRDS